MKKAVILSILFCASIVNAFYAKAQGSWQWARGAGGPAESEGYFVATDPAGNVYVSGNHWGKIHFDSDTIAGSGIYLASYDSTGNERWAVGATAISSTSGVLSISTDQLGNEYVFGMHDTTITFGSYVLTIPGPRNYYLFIAKVDSAGNVKWIKNIGNAACYGAPESPNSIVNDPQGNIYLTCSYSMNATIGAYTFTNAKADSSKDLLVLKLDSSGTIIWGRSFGGSEDDDASGIAVTPAGNIYISGNFHSDSLAFGTTILRDSTVVITNWEIYLVKLDDAGNVIWATQPKGSGGVFNEGGLATNANEEVFISGSYGSTPVSLDTITLLPCPPSQSYGFVAKYDSSGRIRWAKILRGIGLFPYSLRLDPCGNVWTSGTFGGPANIDTLDGHIVNAPSGSIDPLFIAGWSSTGSYLQSSVLASGGDDLNTLATDKCGNLFVESDYKVHSFVVGNDTLITTGTEYNYVAKYDPGLGCSNCTTANVPLIQLLRTITLYPNPVADELNINSSGVIRQLAITDLLGRTVYEHDCNADEVHIDVARFPAGMYLLKINGTEARKFIKE